MKNPNKLVYLLNKNSFIIMILLLLNACGTAEQTQPQPCENDLIFTGKEVSGSFEILTYAGSLCIQNLSEIPGPGRAVISLENIDGTSEITLKSVHKVNNFTFEIELPSDIKSLLFRITRPFDGSRIPSKIRTSQAVMGIRG